MYRYHPFSHPTFNTRRWLVFLLLPLVALTDCTTTQGTTTDTGTKTTTPVYYSANELQYNDRAYKDNIKTVLFYNSNSEVAAPIIALNTGEYLTMRFDDLDNSIKSYNYSILQCNADWTPGSLMEIEYLEGYFQGNITRYEYSFNTYQPYIHYTFNFPNTDTKLLLPGNYIMFVYENGDKQNPVITRRFMVYQQKANITYEYKRPDDVEERNYKQEIDFSVYTNNLTLNNGYSDLRVYMMQNYRWDNMIGGLTPKFVRNNELVYNQDEPNTFQGLNEFRHVSFTSTQVKGNRIFSIDHDSTLYSAILYKDEKRSYKKYMTLGDVNGRYKINRDNSSGEDEHSQSDYMKITFSVDQNTKVTEGDLYLFGLFTDWQIKPEYKMEFNAEMGMYVKTVMLKQGAYDYMYAMVPSGKSKPDEAYIEGTHFDTENQYTILVYQHDIKRNADLLIGFMDFNNANRR